MSFSSPGFLFAFFPFIFLLYFAVPASARNAVLLIGSLAFYTIDGGSITAVLVISIAANQVIGTRIAALRPGGARFALLWFGIALNLAPLVYYKYWTFLLGVGHDALIPAGIHLMPPSLDIVLPAGISFFTFQGLSYLVDVYRGEIAPAGRMLDFGMYHTLFPQLIAGPIVRYVEVEDRIRRRPVSIEDVESGLLRFSSGLGKKIVLADSMGSLADRMFALPADHLTAAAAWIGALTYTLQIYFDFSGYSDMAIGLGRILGFRFPENFDSPYRSLSITEFWRRWHMTLSRWFRDYVYIPLGGNRAGPMRTYVNLFTVFLLCGLWHGAAYTFVVWGAYHGLLLVAERSGARRTRAGGVAGAAFGWCLTMLLVIVGWVIFRSPTLSDALTTLEAMAGLGAVASSADVLAFVTPDKIVFFALACVLSVIPVGRVAQRAGWIGSPVLAVAQRSFALMLFVYSAALISANGFNPFIYFKF